MFKPCWPESDILMLNCARLLAKGQAKRVFIRTWPVRRVIDEKLVGYCNAKSKELLALCVDHMGGEVTMEEAVDKLWPERITTAG